MDTIKTPVRIACLALMGVGVSALISLIASASYGDFLPTSPAGIQTYGVIGGAAISYLAGAAICIGSYYLSHIFNKTDWSVAKRSMVHFISLYAFIMTCGYTAHWMTLPTTMVEFTETAISNAIFIGIYLVFWFVIYRKEKAMTEKMNEKLNQNIK